MKGAMLSHMRFLKSGKVNPTTCCVQLPRNGGNVLKEKRLLGRSLGSMLGAC